MFLMLNKFIIIYCKRVDNKLLICIENKERKCFILEIILMFLFFLLFWVLSLRKNVFVLFSIYRLLFVKVN